MITGINHITFAVADLERSLKFYRDLLRLELVEQWPKGAYLLAGNQWIALNVDAKQVSRPSAHDTHVAFTVPSHQFEQFEAKLRAQGVTPYRENRSEGNSFYFLDPDGHKLEIHDTLLVDRRLAMNDENYWISSPELAIENGLRAYLKAYKETHETLYQELYSGIETDFPAYIRKLKDQQIGLQLPEDWAATTTLFLLYGSEVLGTVRVRHALLNTFAQTYIGHIGYDLKPSARGKGLGNRLIEAGIAEAKKRGLEKVLLLCHEDNLASKALIVNHGGIFESEVVDPNGCTLQRYWISLV